MRFLTFILRALLLVGALAAIGVAAVWQTRPELVEKLDESIQRRYKASITDPVNDAKALLRKDPTLGLPALRSAVDEMPPLFKTDKLFDFKQDARKRLAIALRKAGEIAEAEAVGRTMVDANPKDIPLRLIWIDSLLDADETRDQGIEELDSLARQFPGQPLPMGFVVPTYQRLGMQDRAAHAVARFLGMSKSSTAGGIGLEKPWMCWWSPEKRFTTKRRIPGTVKIEGERVLVRYRVSKGQRFFRINLPVGATCQMEVKAIVAQAGNTRVPIEFDPKTRKSHNLKWNGQELTASGASDAWFSGPIPESLYRKTFILIMQGELKGPTPWIADAVSTPEAYEHALALEEDGQERLARKVGDTQKAAWFAQGLAYTLNGAAGVAALERVADAEGRKRYAFSIPIEAAPDGALRWDLTRPNVPEWAVGGLQALSADGQSLPLDVGTEHVEQRGDTFQFEGWGSRRKSALPWDPALHVTLPSLAAGTNATLQGWIQ